MTTRPKRGALGAVAALGALALLTAGGFLIGLGPADAPVGNHPGAAAAEVPSGDRARAPETAGSRHPHGAPSTPVDPQRLKIPFMAIAGDQDVADATVSFRYRDGSQRNGVPLDEAVAHVVEVVRSRINTGPSAA